MRCRPGATFALLGQLSEDSLAAGKFGKKTEHQKNGTWLRTLLAPRPGLEPGTRVVSLRRCLLRFAIGRPSFQEPVIQRDDEPIQFRNGASDLRRLKVTGDPTGSGEAGGLFTMCFFILPMTCVSQALPSNASVSRSLPFTNVMGRAQQPSRKPSDLAASRDYIAQRCSNPAWKLKLAACAIRRRLP